MLTPLRKLVSPTNPLRLVWHYFCELLALLIYRFPSRKLFVIGVTGTNGKTTTANVVANILEADGKKVALATTVNFQLGKKKWENLTKKTTLGRGGTQRFLRQAIRAGCTHVVLEVSSHALIQHRVLGVKFDAAILTNITHEHLDFHGTFERYREAKERLFWKLAKNKKAEGVAILPAEDPEAASFFRIPDIGIISYGVKDGEIHAENLTVRDLTQNFKVIAWDKEFKLTTKLLGNFNIANILAATSLALALKIKPAVIQKAIKQMNPVPGRLEPIFAGQPFRVIVDFAHTPDALEKLLHTFRGVTKGRTWLVFGATGDRDRSKRPIMGQIADHLADEIVLTSDDPFTEDPVQIVAEISTGIKRKEGEHFYCDIDRHRAINYALSNAEKDDTVLIAGKGCEQFQVVGHRKIPWDDRRVAAEVLKKKF